MIKQAMDAYAASLNKQWAHDRTKTVGASEVGQCARKTWYSKNEVRIQDCHDVGIRDDDYKDSYGARLRGTVMENEFWFPALKAKYGDHLHFAGPEQQTFVSGYLSATPDGLIEGLPINALKHLGVKDISDVAHSDCIMVECKTVDPRTSLTEPKPENVFQVHVQLGLVRELTPHNPYYSVLSYTNASFWDDVTEFAIKFEPKVFAVAMARATEIMTAGSAQDLKPEGFIAGGRECNMCPFTQACGQVRRNVPENPVAADPQFTAEIAELVATVKALEDAGETNATRVREVQQQIRDRLRERNVKKIPGLVSWSTVKGRKTYDNARIKEAAIEAGIDIEQYAKIGEEADRLTITAPKQTAA